MSCAMPRPATMRISVAMIGCMPTLATSRPFHRPHNSAMPMAAAMARLMGKRLTSLATEPPIIQAASAAAMATTAPTEMSMPRVAMTSVMPSDTSTRGRRG